MRTYEYLITYQQNKKATAEIGNKPYEYDQHILGHALVPGLNKELTEDNIITIIDHVKKMNDNTEAVIILNAIRLADEKEE